MVLNITVKNGTLILEELRPEVTNIFKVFGLNVESLCKEVSNKFQVRLVYNPSTNKLTYRGYVKDFNKVVQKYLFEKYMNNCAFSVKINAEQVTNKTYLEDSETINKIFGGQTYDNAAN